MHWRVGLLIAIAGGVLGQDASRAQTVAPVPASDEQAVRSADDAFWRAFNACDAAAMADYFTQDVEFYHDLTGLTRTRAAVVASLIKGPCGTPGLHLRRELLPQSVHYQAIPGYGAMLTGDHLFHAREGNAPERPATLARFLVIWKRQPDRWAMTRIVSYDHRPAPYRSSSTPIPVPLDKLRRYVGRYHTETSGEVDVSLDRDVLVLRSGGLRVTLAASAPGHFFAQEKDLRINFSGSPRISEIEIEENGVVVARGLRVGPR